MSLATRIPVLMYHRVGHVGNAREARYAISPHGFADHMRKLAASGYHAVEVGALLDWLEAGKPLREGAFLLTFDDGFRGVREHALPVLEKLGWPFTVFLVSDLIGGEDVWIKRSDPAAATFPLLAADEIHDMQQRGCSFQSHTRSHASLPALDDAELADQLRGSRMMLAELLGQEVHALAYPYGHCDARVEAAVRAAGYRAAFSTESGFNRQDANPYRIRRLDVFGSDTAASLLRKIRLGSNDGSLAGQMRYLAGRLAKRIGVR